MNEGRKAEKMEKKRVENVISWYINKVLIVL